MSESEPAVLREPRADTRAVTLEREAPEGPEGREGPEAREGPEGPEGREGRAPVPTRTAPTVHVAGFWKRAIASLIDLGVIIPSALLVTWIVSKIAGVHLPPSNLRLRDIDGWIDLVLMTDPALIMGVGMLVAIGLVYALVFQIVLGRTLGMRLLRIKIIDVYGDSPSPARCAARCGGYLVGIATLFLGFLWIGFDSEKRGVQDWIAGTYVIRE